MTKGGTAADLGGSAIGILAGVLVVAAHKAVGTPQTWWAYVPLLILGAPCLIVGVVYKIRRAAIPSTLYNVSLMTLLGSIVGGTFGIWVNLPIGNVYLAQTLGIVGFIIVSVGLGFALPTLAVEIVKGIVAMVQNRQVRDEKAELLAETAPVAAKKPRAHSQPQA